jgi:hypothetical protein
MKLQERVFYVDEIAQKRESVNDKKLLWRANLYMDEGANDWNNLNPWDDLVNNDWYVSQADGADVNGGQIPLHSFTRYWDNVTIENAVAYSWGCCDSPFDFNDDIGDQINTIQAWYTANPIAGDSTLTNQLQNWNTGIAPDNSFGYTDDGNNANDFDNYLVNYRFGEPVADSHDYTALEITVNNITDTYYPYTPGFSSLLRWGMDENNYAAVSTCYSAGADCSAFVQRCASYNGNNYDAPDIVETRNTWSDHYPGDDRPLIAGGFENASWMIADNDDDTWIDLLVPGDIIIKEDPTWGWHMGLIGKINFTSNRQIAITEVFIIEAFGVDLKVTAIRNLETWQQRGRTYWHIKRLKI